MRSHLVDGRFRSLRRYLHEFASPGGALFIHRKIFDVISSVQVNDFAVLVPDVDNYAGAVLRNGLISLLDQPFPCVNTLFGTQPRQPNGHFSCRFLGRLSQMMHKVQLSLLPV